MKYIILYKNWKINKEYNKNKLLYLLVDRPDEILERTNVYYWYSTTKKIYWYRNYNFPSVVHVSFIEWWGKNHNVKRREKIVY